MQRMSVKTGRSPPVQAIPPSGTAKLADNWQSCDREPESAEDGRLLGECHGSLWRHRPIGEVPGVRCVFYVWFQPFYSLSLYSFPAELLPSTLIRTSGLLSYKSCLVGTGQGHHGSLMAPGLQTGSRVVSRVCAPGGGHGPGRAFTVQGVVTGSARVSTGLTLAGNGLPAGIRPGGLRHGYATGSWQPQLRPCQSAHGSATGLEVVAPVTLVPLSEQPSRLPGRTWWWPTQGNTSCSFILCFREWDFVYGTWCAPSVPPCPIATLTIVPLG